MENVKIEKVTIGKINKVLVDKSRLYKELTGVKTVELVETLLEDFFKDKILTNDFIELEKHFYFNLSELFKEGLTTATNIKPITNLEDVAILKKVPINLDSFSNEFKTYCYNENSNIHRGLYLYPDLIYEGYLVIDFNPYYILFNYDLSKEVIDLSLIENKDDIDLYIDSENSNVLFYLENESEIIKNLIDDAYLDYDFFEVLFKPTEVFQSYKEIKRMYLFFTGDLIKDYIQEHIEFDKELESINTIDLITISNELLKEHIEFNNFKLYVKENLDPDNIRKKLVNELEEKLVNENLRNKALNKLKKESNNKKT